MLAWFKWRHYHVVKVDFWCTSEVWFHRIGQGSSKCHWSMYNPWHPEEKSVEPRHVKSRIHLKLSNHYCLGQRDDCQTRRHKELYHKTWIKHKSRKAVDNVSGNRCEFDCRSRGRELDSSPVPYFRGDWLWNNFYGHSPHLRWIIQEGLLSVTSESVCTKHWLTVCSSLPRKKVWLGELTVLPWP